MKKYLTVKEVVKEKLKDAEFRKYYEEEGRKLEIGYKIAELRRQAGLSQKEFAEKIHTSQTAVARLERGDYLGYSLRILEKVALVTGTHLEINFR